MQQNIAEAFLIGLCGGLVVLIRPQIQG